MKKLIAFASTRQQCMVTEARGQAAARGGHCIIRGGIFEQQKLWHKRKLYKRAASTVG
jgi:hypothetical protein